MKTDQIDQILEQWTAERPDLDTASLGVVIRIMSLNRAFLRQATEALAGIGLELWEYDVLSALRRQGEPWALPATVLARETELSSGAMTNRIDRLEQRDLVRRGSDATDRRSVVVSLTPAGKALIDDAMAHRVDAARASLASLSADERRTLSDLLRRVVLDAADEDV